MTPVIATKQLRKEFGPKVAVADLTLEVNEGEVFGFLGPNGAGKTTCVKMLLGLIAPTAGAGTILGQPLGDRAARARVGYLPEHFRFHEWLKAGEFLDLHGKLYGMDAARRAKAIPELLQLVGLSHQAQAKVGTFSKGMQQRLGLAQALLNDPELVFLDEPTSGLDPMGRRLVRDIINDLRQEGVTVFLNSHLLSEVELTCDRAAFIRQGLLVQTIPLHEWQQENIQVSLRVGTPTPELWPGLAQFGTVLSRSDHDNGPIKLALAHESQIPGLVAWLVAAGFSLYELSPSRLSLEDRFIQIVGPDASES